MKKILIVLFFLAVIGAGVYVATYNILGGEEGSKNGGIIDVISDKISSTNEPTIESFKSKLEQNGLSVTDTIQKSATLIGAEEGYGYTINGVAIEIYKFDTKSDEELTKINIKSAKDKEKVTMPSFGDYELSAKYNKGLVLTNYEEHPDKDKIIEIFNDL